MPATVAAYDDLARYHFDPHTRYVVRFLNPTANKPLHVGHLRSAAIGSATHAILRAGGARAARHCLIEDAGRYMFEGLAGFSRLGLYFPPPSVRAKSDHVVGWCFQKFRQAAPDHQEDEAELPGRPDLADELNRRWAGDEEGVRSFWRQIRTLALLGQQETLRDLNIQFDYCDFESAEDAYAPALLEEGITKGIFTRRSNGEVYYQAGSDPAVELTDRFAFPLENLRLLSFLRRLYTSDSWMEGTVNVVVAGTEWRKELSQYVDLLQKLGIQRAPEIYLPIFIGMVRMGGRKVASRSGHGVLADDLLDLVKSVSGRSLGSPGPSASSTADAIASILIISFLLSHSRSEDLEFSVGAVLDDRRNPGWPIARCWLELHHGESAESSEAPCDPQCVNTIARARARLSFEEPVALLRSLSTQWLRQRYWRTADQESGIRFLIKALGLWPALTERRPFEVSSLLEAGSDFTHSEDTER